MNMKTNLLDDYVNFVDTATKQNLYFKIIILLIVFILTFFFLNVTNT